MAGTNCNSCIFSGWQDQTQVGCSMDRLTKYENIDVLKDDKNGTYKVLTKNICNTKRTKSWLSEYPRNPVEQVRKEVFPKLQLIVLVDECNESWDHFFSNTDFSKYSAVDVLVFTPEMEYIKSIGNMISHPNIFMHACLPVERSICSAKEYYINQYVRKDCQYYVLTDDPGNTRINDWPDKLDNFVNEQCKGVLSAAELDAYGETIHHNNMLISTPLHFMLGGYGSQPIDHKISIHAINHDQGHLLRYSNEILDTEGFYNVEEGNV